MSFSGIQNLKITFVECDFAYFTCFGFLTEIAPSFMFG